MAVRGAPARRRVRCKFMLPALLLLLAITNVPAAAAAEPRAGQSDRRAFDAVPHAPVQRQASDVRRSRRGRRVHDPTRHRTLRRVPQPRRATRLDWRRPVHVPRPALSPPRARRPARPTLVRGRLPTGTARAATDTCPPGDASLWGRQAGIIAAHTRGVIDDFEIVNEPDGRWAFLGTPQQYAAMLQASYNAIHAANPNAQVALGGLMNIGTAGQDWMNTMLATPGTDAPHKFDIANIHIRTPPAQTSAIVASWRRYFAAKGFNGPSGLPKPAIPLTQPNKPTPATKTARPPKPATSPPRSPT